MMFIESDTIIWMGALGDFVSALLSLIVLCFVWLEYRANQFFRHKESVFLLEKDLLFIQERLLKQTGKSTFSTLLMELVMVDNLNVYLDNYPDIKMYALTFEELIIKTENKGFFKKQNEFNREKRLNLNNRVTLNEIKFLKRLDLFCPKLITYFTSLSSD